MMHAENDRATGFCVISLEVCCVLSEACKQKPTIRVLSSSSLKTLKNLGAVITQDTTEPSKACIGWKALTRPLT